MSRRSVTHIDAAGSAVSLVCNPLEWWSPRSSLDVIVDIENGQHTYWAVGRDRIARRIIVIEGRLCAPDQAGLDTLRDLPRC
jgi:hypothetical protein